MTTTARLDWRPADSAPDHAGTVLLATNATDSLGPRFVTGWAHRWNDAGTVALEWWADGDAWPLPPGAVDWWTDIPAPPELPSDPPHDDPTPTDEDTPE